MSSKLEAALRLRPSHSFDKRGDIRRNIITEQLGKRIKATYNTAIAAIARKDAVGSYLNCAVIARATYEGGSSSSRIN